MPHIHYPVLLDFGFFKIYTWGFIAGLGFLFAILLALKFSNLKPEHTYNIGFLAVLGGLIGGRLLYFAYYPSELGFFNLFKIWKGGMSIFGGMIFSFVFICFYVKWKKLDLLRTLDEIIPWAVFGFIIGRIACLVGDGGHVGKEANFMFAVFVNNAGYHWTALYSFFALVVLFLLILNLRQYKFFKGFYACLFLVYYGVVRFIIDFFRADPLYYGLTIAQYLSIAGFIIGLILCWRLIKK